MLGQFVVDPVSDAAASAVVALQKPGGLGETGGSRVAHLGRAPAGVLLLWGLRTLLRAVERTDGPVSGKLLPLRR